MHSTIPDMPRSDQPSEAYQCVFYDGNERSVYVVDQEIPFPKGKLIVSRTDTAGIITHANEAFVEMSGYSREALIGQPHYILRHPDMPAAAYKDLWQTIEQRQKWHGYVKNLRQDGCYYWVYATIVPNIRQGKLVGYSSVRREPSRAKIQEAERQYQSLLSQEA